MDSTTNLCKGCFRTIEEIINWQHSSEEQKKIILQKVENRKLDIQRDSKKN
jgi:uncharacterized protein